MAENTEVSSVSHTIKKLYIQSDLCLIFKQSFYHDEQDEIDEYHLILLKYIDNPALIEEWKQNLDDADCGKQLNK